MGRPALEVADIFRTHGPAWRKAQRGHLSLGQLKVMSAIEQCRSAALGGHVLRCEGCGHDQIAYNSCRNRHCPKCQASAARRWLEARQADLLPVEYYHVVFTLPAPIADIAYQNKAVIYGLLFDVAAETLLTIAADPKHLGAQHRRDPGAAHLGLGADASSRMCTASCPAAGCRRTASAGSPAGPASSCRCACSRGCSGAASSKSSQQAHRAGQLQFFGEHAALADARALRRLARAAAHSANGSSTPSARSPDPRRCWPICRATPTAWRSPTAGWSRMDERGVTFRWKDYRAKGKTRHKTMTLDADEFMRRFLLHVLPGGFHRIRHYGLLANGSRKANLARARELLHAVARSHCANLRRRCRARCRAADASSARTAAPRCSSSRPSRAGSRSARHRSSQSPP